MNRKEINKKLRFLMGNIERSSRKNKVLKPVLKIQDSLLGLYRKSKEYRETWRINKKGIYFVIQKVGSSNLGKLFSKNITYVGSNIPNDRENYFKFTFVRNPYDRVVSCWKNKICDNDFDNTVRLKHGIEKNISFKEFVKIVSQIPDVRADRHILSQHQFVTDKKGNLLIDFVGKMESFENDAKKVCKKLDIDIEKIPRENKSKRKHKDYREYYDEETKKLVEDRYKKDLEMFGYSF